MATVSAAGVPLVTGFCAQMFCAGAIAVILCPLTGTNPLQDSIHWVAALVYIADHAALFSLLGTRAPFVVGFWASFVLMSISTAVERRLSPVVEAASGSPIPSERRLFDAAQYGFMLGEYGLFICFLNGMVSGLRS